MTMRPTNACFSLSNGSSRSLPRRLCGVPLFRQRFTITRSGRSASLRHDCYYFFELTIALHFGGSQWFPGAASENSCGPEPAIRRLRRQDSIKEGGGLPLSVFLLNVRKSDFTQHPALMSSHVIYREIPLLSIRR